ncbi:MAG: sugar phosphate isomerase/epimerase [Gemmatimonadaceae bacterium]|nr:sugar phosphate isomerase/epimerase [Gemmatimonadaceae bacterium]
MTRDSGLGTRDSLTRRDFLGRATAAAVLGSTGFFPNPDPGRAESRVTNHGALSPIGVQLYTVRRHMQESVERTLEQVARIGYREVEFAGYFGRPAREIRSLLDANGLTAPSAHSADMSAVRTRLPQVLEEAGIIGHRYVICASLPRMEPTADGFRRLAEEFNRAGAEAAKAGITFGFHNHAGELAPLGDTTGYDILLAECDPSLVTMQMDLFWTRRGGRDPLEFFAKHPGRFSSVHVKDMDASGAMVDVGAGQLPFARWFARSEQAGIRHYFVEHDSPQDPMASITASYRHLASLR